MRITLWSLLAVYVAGFIGVFVLHATGAGMHTLPLVLLRSALWPIWITTGHPHGRPLGMD